MDPVAVSASIAKFSAKFFNQLDKTKNMVCSPLSSEYVLAILALGAVGDSHSELLTALGFPNDDAIRSGFKSVSDNLQAVQGVTLDIANKICIKSGAYEIQEQLKKDAITVFHASIDKVNFDNGSAAAALINKWVEDKTHKKIKNLVLPSNFNKDTSVILLNTLYFQGYWGRQFDPKYGSFKPFYVNKETKVDAPFMYSEEDYGFLDSKKLRAQLLRIEYVASDVSMLIVLPTEIDGLDTVLEKLASGYDLLADLKGLSKTKVKAFIPKFKIESELDFVDVLKELGIISIFHKLDSGLTKIIDKPEPLYVSQAIQKAYIEIDEEGSVVTTGVATPMLFRETAGSNAKPEVTVVADRPFLYALLKDDTQFMTGVYRIP